MTILSSEMTIRGKRLPSPGSQFEVLLDRNLAQELEVREHFAGAEDDTAERIVGDRDGQSGFFTDTLIEILDECAAAGKHDAAVADVGGELGGRTFERHSDGVHDGRNAFAEGLANFAVVYGDGLGHTFNQITALDFHGQRLVERVGGADFHLNLLGSALTDQEVIFPLEVIHDGLIHLIAGHANGARINDSAKRDDCDVGSAAANVDDHVAAGLSDWQTRANGGHHGLLHQVNFTRLGAIGGIHDGPLFNLRDFRGYADHDSRMHEHLAVMRFLDEVVQHLFRDFEIGDDSIFHRLDRHDVAGRAPQHFFGFFADGLDFVGVLVQGNDRGFVDDDALTARIHQCVG